MPKPFETPYREEDRFSSGVYGLPNNYRIDADGFEVPVDPEHVQSGELPGQPDKPDAAPGNSRPFRPL